jgi:hypothetical protein
MVQQVTPESSGSNFASREGTPENPYPLHWPASWYERAGHGLGFEFTPDEIQRAREDTGVLGVERYEPTEEALVELRIPEGSYVKCYVH